MHENYTFPEWLEKTSCYLYNQCCQNAGKQKKPQENMVFPVIKEEIEGIEENLSLHRS